MKKRSLVLTICLSLLMLSFGIALLGNKLSGSHSLLAASDAEERFVVVATSSIGLDKSYGGYLVIGNESCWLDGSVAYFENTDTPVMLNLEATPRPYFEFVRFEVYSGTWEGNGDFTRIDGPIDIGNPASVDNKTYTIALNLPNAGDYEVHVVFRAIKYNLSVSMGIYNDNVTDPATLLGGSSGFIIGSSQSAVWDSDNVGTWNANSALISLDYELTFENYFEGGYPIRFAYAAIQHKDGSYIPLGTSVNAEYGITYSNNVYTVKFNDKVLEDFAKDGGIIIKGVYVRTFSVSVSTQVTNDNAVHNLDLLLTTLSMIDVQTGKTYPATGQSVNTHKSLSNAYLDEGTVIEVYLKPNAGYTFESFAHTGTALANNIIISSNQLNCTVQTAITINVKYRINEYTVVIGGRDTTGNEIDLSNAYALVNGSKSLGGEVKLNDTLNKIVFDQTIPGTDVRFIYDSVTIRLKNDFIRLLDNTVITPSFLQDHVNDGIVEVMIVYKKQLSLTIENLSPLMGSYSVVKLDDSGNPTGGSFILNGPTYYDAGTKLRITATAISYHSFQGFSGISDTGAGQTVADITINYSREIYISFAAMSYSVVNDLSSGQGSYNTNNTIRITFDDVPANHVIKQWKINGIPYTTLPNQGTDVRLEDNTLVIKLTKDVLDFANADGRRWIVDGVFKIENEVVTGFSSKIIFTFAIPGAVLAVLLIALLTSVLINTKRKKLIKAQLIEKRTEKIRRDIGGYISDLKTGKETGQITKEDIKKAMKEKKEKK